MFKFLQSYNKRIISENDRKKAEELNKVREAVLEYLLSDNGIELFDAIARQKRILQREGRSCIAIFISIETMQHIMFQMFAKQEEKVNDLLGTLLSLEVPVAHLGDLPVYISPFLTKAPIFVIGEISWEIRYND